MGAGGVHFGLGANLARLELQKAFRGLGTRLDTIELAAPVERMLSSCGGGITRVRVRGSVQR